MSAPVEGWGTKTRWGGEAIGAWSMGSMGDVDGGRGYSWCFIATLGTILMIGSGGSRGMYMFAIAYALHERDKEDHNFEITW